MKAADTTREYIHGWESGAIAKPKQKIEQTHTTVREKGKKKERGFDPLRVDSSGNDMPRNRSCFTG
jgi:hypothetical protein